MPKDRHFVYANDSLFMAAYLNMQYKETHTPLSLFCDKLIEAGWLAAIVLSALFMNIYTHRMFEPDKSCLVRSIALFMVIAWLVKIIELKRIPPSAITIEEKKSSWKPVWLPVLLLTISYTISLIFSSVPFDAGFWGSYDRLQGVYTTFSYFIIFLLAATHLKEKEQIDRLINTMVLTSVPIIIYALIQRLAWDPVPWKGSDPSDRVSATMGNPIFFSAYLIMVVPLTLARLIISIKKFINLKNVDKYLPFILILIGTQLVSIALAKSRGPMAGCLAGISSFFIIWAIITYIHYKKIIPLIITVALVILSLGFIILVNTPGPLQEACKKIRYLERLTEFRNFKEGSGRTRMILWTGVLRLMKEASPLQKTVGYGPESIGTVFYRQHSTELTGLEGKAVHADRTHNTFLDHWFMRGFFGLFTYLFLLASFFYVGFKTLWKNRDNLQYQFLLIGLISAGIAHIIETGVGIDIVVTQTYFWLSFACLWGISKITESKQIINSTALSKKKSDPINEPSLPQNKNFSGFISRGIFWTYVGVTFSIFYAIMTQYWPDVTYPMTMLDLLIIGSYLWFLAALPLGALAITRYNIKIYRGPTIVPFSNFLIYLIFLGAGSVIFAETNLKQIRADGAYKFCFSYDNEATILYESLSKRPPGEALQAKQIIFNMRIDSIRYYQQAIKLAPQEKTYLNGAGRNFMELTRLSPSYLPANLKNSSNPNLLEISERMNSIFSLNVPPEMKTGLPLSEIFRWLTQQGVISEFPDKLTATPDLKELLTWEQKTAQDKTGKNIFAVYNDRPNMFFLRFSPRDFIRSCFICIKAAYQLEPDNFERIIALANVYNHWGIFESDMANYQEALINYEEALKLYQKATQASPLNKEIPTQIETVKNKIQWIKSLS